MKITGDIIMPRTHDKLHFYKYMTVSTAKAVLQNCSLRWSAPLLFNDPFDNQFDLQVNFSPDELLPALRNELQRVLYNRGGLTFDTDSPFGQIIQLMGNRIPNMPPEQLMPILEPALQQTVANVPRFVQGINGLLQSGMQMSRLLCVSEVNDNLLMWSHYADSHSGVVIQLKCVEEVDNAILAAKPIVYSDEIPTIGSVEDFTKLACGQAQRETILNSWLHTITFTKSADWKYEKEWRVSAPHLRPVQTLHDDYRENPIVFGEVIFGCSIKQEDKVALITLINSKPEYSHIKLYQAEKHPTKFDLNFVEIAR
jgi:Protein of unknown function (DUF2971)